MADLITVQDNSTGDPILLNRDMIVNGRQLKDTKRGGFYSSFDLANGNSISVRGTWSRSPRRPE